MDESSFASQELKVYRLTWYYQLYHFAIGAAALVGAAKCYDFLILAVVLALFSVFMIARPLVMEVTVDPSYIMFRGVFSSNSLQRSSITAVETKNTGKGNILIFWGNIDEKESLAIPDIFSFDEAWKNWLITYRDLSNDKPINLL